MKTDRISSGSDFHYLEGNDYFAYKYLGVHRDTKKYVFRVHAPSAISVALVSDLTGWEDGVPMEKIGGLGVWEARLYTCKNSKGEILYSNIEGMRYKFKIAGQSGVVFKCDPYAFAFETSDGFVSVVNTKNSIKFRDHKWEEKRRGIKAKDGVYSAPLNIYEMALSSFLTRDGRSSYQGNEALNYREIADSLVTYVRQMGYTHVELIDIFKENASGCQIFHYSPDTKYGSSDDFKYFINKLHNNGIGVIVLWKPARFGCFNGGLCKMDGTNLYELPIDCGDDSGEKWRYYDFSKRNVKKYLISNAVFWLEEFHIDGIRLDGLDHLVYIDCENNKSVPKPNKYGGMENLDAVDFIKQLNYYVEKEYPDRLMIADACSSLEKITHDVRADGLGFSFVFNDGWSRNVLEYVSTDPWFRRKIHHYLTFPMTYAFSEHHLLPVTFDMVSGVNDSLINRMFGNYNQKFSGMRSYLVYRMTYPGKKLSFMGCEFAQFRKWEKECQLEWFMLDFDMHNKFQRFNADVNHMYLNDKRLYEVDFSWNGFQWIYADKDDENVIAYKRFDKEGNELVVVINFSGAEWKNFTVNVEGSAAVYKLILNSDCREYGGGYDLPQQYATCNVNGRLSFVIDSLPPLTALVFEPKSNVVRKISQ